jgi:8-oxo-dGTP pyrophosphatase MutT (NUDIX family)
LTPATVRAAGGVVWRRRDDGAVEVLLVHRPRYDDWSLPKGKCADGEPDVRCALREVEEETGLRCDAGDALATVEYVDGRGRPKVVRYWAMTVREDLGFSRNDEVDAVEWLPVAEAAERLSYRHDAGVLEALTS